MTRLVVWLRLALASVAALALFDLVRPLPAAEMTLEELIEAVRENELLYANIDVRMRYRYEKYSTSSNIQKTTPKGGKSNRAAPPSGEPEMLDIRTDDSEFHCVYQGDFFYVKRQSYETYFSADPMRTHGALGYDGRETRTLNNSIGNVREGRVPPSRSRLAPHTLLFTWVTFPLSEYLMGRSNRSTPPGVQHMSYVGTEVYKGLRCAVVRLIARRPGGPATIRCDTWLAEERNYIPVKNVTYRLLVSDEEPDGHNEVLEWTEVEPGIWFPKRVRLEAYYIDRPHMPGKAALNWRSEYTLVSVSLHPAYEPSFFTLKFPEGTLVYHVDGTEITKSYVIGAPGSAAESGEAQTPLWHQWRLLIGAFAMGAIAIAIWLIKRKRWRRIEGQAP